MNDKRSFSFSKLSLNGSASESVLPNALMSRSFSTKEVGAIAANPIYTPSRTKTAKATCYLWGCCFYNCCCCCFNCCCAKWVGPWCGKDFMFENNLICLEYTLTRATWLRRLHFFCFLLHTTWATLSWREGYGKPMEVQLYRVKPTWTSTGIDGYTYEVAKADDWKPRIDTVTALFFLLSAISHGVWVFVSPTPLGASLLWNWLDNALCWWLAIAFATTRRGGHRLTLSPLGATGAGLNIRSRQASCSSRLECSPRSDKLM